MGTTYYHIRIDYFDDKLKVNQTVCLFDIPQIETVKEDYVIPYLSGKQFFFSGVRLMGSDIRKMRIFQSQKVIQQCVDIANQRIPNNVIYYYGKKEVLPYKDLVEEITEVIIKETERLLFVMPQTEKQILQNEKKPLVFISHSSKDKDFVDELVDLLESMGLDSENLFCSSIPGYWIGLGKDIFQELFNLFTDRNLYVIFVHSPRYYRSTVSLNEMGAAWVLKSGFCSFLTSDMEFGDMTGVINSNMIGIKCNAKDASERLDEFKKQVLDFLGLPDLDNTKWNRKKNKFLANVSEIEYSKDEILNSSGQYIVDEDKMKAYIHGEILKGEKGTRILIIHNIGKSTANNLNVEWLNEKESEGVFVRGDFTSIGNLTPMNKREYYIVLAVGHPELMKLRYHWKDEYSDSNSFDEDLQL